MSKNKKNMSKKEVDDFFQLINRQPNINVPECPKHENGSDRQDWIVLDANSSFNKYNF